ncbi:hypothetical protein P4O66_014168, partial [Electrophorus voltai]
ACGDVCYTLHCRMDRDSQAEDHGQSWTPLYNPGGPNCPSESNNSSVRICGGTPALTNVLETLQTPSWTYEGRTVARTLLFILRIPAENLTWTLNTSSVTKRAQQRLYFLQKPRKAHLPSPILTTFYRGTVESILSSCIITWFGNCTSFDRKTLQRIVRTAEKIIGVSHPSITNIYITSCSRKATNIVKDPTDPSHELFILLPSGR